MTTDTPRTDSVMEAEAEVERLKAERELYQAANADVKRIAEERNKAEAEVDTLNHQLLKAENDLLQSQDINSFLDAEFRIACKRAERAEAEVERLRGLLNAHAEFLIKNGFYLESRDLMGGSWSDGFVALAKKYGINPYDQ